MRDWLAEGVDPDEVNEVEDTGYDDGMTDEQLDAAHADMLAYLQETTPPTMAAVLEENGNSHN